MSLPDTYEEWKKKSRAWRRRARELVGDAEFSQPRRRPRDADEKRALRDLGLDDWQPFAGLRNRDHPASCIRRTRLHAGLTQAELGERLGMKQQQIQQLEDPRRSNPTWETVEAVAAALGRRATLTLDDEEETRSIKAASAGSQAPSRSRRS